MAVRHRDVVLAHLKELGLRLNVRKVYFSSTDYPLIWAWCGIRPRCRHVCPLLRSSQSSRQSRVREGRSLTVKRFQKLLGLMSAASNVIPFGLLYMRPLQWWLKTKRGKPTLHDQGHAAMPTCLRHVEETFGFCLKAWCWELLVASLSAWGVKQIWRTSKQVWQRGHLVPQKRSTQLEFPKGNVPGYVCNHGSQRDRDTVLLGHTSGITSRAMHHS